MKRLLLASAVLFSPYLSATQINSTGKGYVQTGTVFTSNSPVFVSVYRFEDLERKVVCYVSVSELAKNSEPLSLSYSGRSSIPTPTMQCMKME